MKKLRNYTLTIDLLKHYCVAALKNASQLLEEATLLEINGHYARTYFLAVAAIEETGKANLAFDAQCRNLKESAVVNKIKKSFENHSSKINAAFMPWLKNNANNANSMEKALELMVHLKLGREPSMYTDVSEDEVTVQSPENIIRPIAAKDCVRLACDFHKYSSWHITNNKPIRTTRTQDELFAIKSATFNQMLNNIDFWEFYTDSLKNGLNKFEDTVMTYYNQFFKKQSKYKSKHDDM
jgi:AbiV family abortive infection protein